MNKSELKLLRDKCLLFNHFIIEKGNFPQDVLPAIEESSRLVEEHYQKGFAKPLKIMSVDIDAQVRHMPISMANEIKKIFEKTLGIEYTILEEKNAKILIKIIKHGKIKDRTEYELVVNRIDEIYAYPEKREELNKLNNLLSSYKE